MNEYEIDKQAEINKQIDKQIARLLDRENKLKRVEVLTNMVVMLMVMLMWYVLNRDGVNGDSDSGGGGDGGQRESP